MTIQESIDIITESFSTATTGLFEITGRYQKAFEQGIYGCLIAKPTRRMKSALGVDREILVVASTFNDQQQRIIKFIRREIDDSYGRFEQTVVIVIHCDPDGGTKLRNWGRDQGLAVLPLRYESKFGSAESIEHELCVELYSHDPFDVTGPVSDDSNFYGRRDEAIELARKLQRGQIRSCLGIRKIGKTSIINRVLREIRTNHESTCLVIDCSRDDVWSLNAAELMSSLTESLSAAISNQDKYVDIFTALPRETSLANARLGLLEIVTKATVPVVIVFDEVDYITPGSPTAQHWTTDFNIFWRNLRSVYQEAARLEVKLSILIGGVSSYWFSKESIAGVENAALSFIPEEYLSPMPEGATVAMLKRLGKVAGLQFEETSLRAIARATGNMPYWARKCSSYIHRQIPVLERPCRVASERVEPLIEAFVAEEGAAIAEVAMKHLFRVHPGLREAVASCVGGRAEEVSETDLRTLRRYGLIDLRGQLSGQMMACAYESVRKDVRSVSTPVDTAKEQPSGLGEWAEEIAALGQRRNVLERKLRAIAVNFIRMSALQGGGKVDIRTRVLAVLPEDRRARLKHMTIDEVVDRFLWTDLLKMIVREWSLFERIFGNRLDFQHHGDIINERYDAHAKAADRADFALYRRSLSWFEEKVATLQ